jgi:FAD/FMN-containing dehydrogenase
MDFLAPRSSFPSLRPAPPSLRGLYRDDLVARAVYAEGAGISRAVPSGVAVPADADDVSELVRWASAHGIALIARGSGSGMAGGAVGRGIIVDLSRLNAIGDVDVARRRVCVGAGALRGTVDGSARAHRLRFPVDPSSGVFCTVGGMASTNASGARTLRYGATRAWVSAAECVFTDGVRAIIRRGEPPTPVPEGVERFLASVAPRAANLSTGLLKRRGVRKESSGYALAEFAQSSDVLDVILGSEGTLCLITALELALDAVPAATASVLAAFPSIEYAVDGAHASREGGASASELLDRTFLEVAAIGGTRVVPPETETALLVEVEGSAATETGARSRSIADACEAAGASMVRVALDEETERELWALRHAASPILSRLDPHLKSMQFIEDGAVPPDDLPAYVKGVRSALAAREIRGVIFGHAGDAHVHVNPLIDVRVPEWREQVEGLLDEVTSLVASLGGTLAGEHGDGRIRAPLAPRTWSAEAMDLFASVKRAFDPDGLFNPGVKVPVEGQRAIEEVKYDPSLEPLPTHAREVLDAIERERGYARFRLSLL